MSMPRFYNCLPVLYNKLKTTVIENFIQRSYESIPEAHGPLSMNNIAFRPHKIEITVLGPKFSEKDARGRHFFLFYW